MLLSLLAIFFNTRSLHIHKTKHLHRGWVPVVLKYAVVSQSLFFVLGVSLLVVQHGSLFSIVTLFAAAACQYLSFLCLAIPLILPFKQLATVKVIDRLIYGFKFQFRFLQPLLFLMYAFCGLRFYDVSRNIVIGFLNIYIATLILSLICMLIYSVCQVNRNMSRQIAVLPLGSIEAILLLRKQVKLMCCRLLFIQIVVGCIVSRSAYQIIRTNQYPYGWIVYPTNFCLISTGTIVSSHIVQKKSSKVHKIVSQLEKTNKEGDLPRQPKVESDHLVATNAEPKCHETTNATSKVRSDFSYKHGRTAFSFRKSDHHSNNEVPTNSIFLFPRRALR